MKLDLKSMMEKASKAGGVTDRVATQPQGESTFNTKNSIGRLLGKGRGGSRE